MPETTVDRTYAVGTLWRRWPTALGVAFAAFLLTGADVQDNVAQLAALLPLEYLLVAKLGRRDLTWPLIAALFVVTFAVTAVDAIPPSIVFAAMALAVLVWSAIDRQLLRSGELQIQALGTVGIGLLVLVGLIVDPGVGLYVVAATWFLHGIWDFVHIWRDKVVPRSYAEWCGVLDLLIAFGLVVLV
ncbi:MAG: hypothetical protein ACRDP9_25900 [Kribbellaceae bacterium]